ncbi:rRNA-processing protein utp21 [Thecaphora frezii]
MANPPSQSAATATAQPPRSAKRQRHQLHPQLAARNHTNAIISKQRLFAPFRALGLISNHVPFVLQTRFGGKDATRPDINVITCLGDSWAMWEAERMTLLFVGPSLPDPISALAISTSPDSVLAAAGTKVYRFVRGKMVAVYDTVDALPALAKPQDSDDSESDSDDDNSSTSTSSHREAAAEQGTYLSSLLVFGDSIVALAADGRSMFVWSLATTEHLRRFDFADGFTATSIVHPATYLNKVVVGSASGELQIWNIRTGALIHAFDGATLKKMAHGSSAAADAVAGGAVVCLVQSPAVDVIAIGFADGDVLVHDIRLDEPLFSLHVDGGLSSGSISFRNDGRAHTVAVATNTGNISIFDLDPTSSSSSSSSQRPGPKLSHSLREAHEGAVGSIEFVPGQALLVSSGGDNSFKQWFFESPTIPPRLLKMRGGHHQPPHLIRYYGDDGKNVLSAGRDRSVRCISVVRDSRSFELSQGQLEKRSHQLSVSVASLKLPPASSISYSNTRSRDWDDVLTTHQAQQFAHTWTVRDKRMGSSALAASQSKKVPAEARTGCVSACGNFALVGNSEGLVEAYNMQSYLHRRTYDTRPLDPLAKQKAKQHGVGSKKAAAALKARAKGSAVTGIATDALNRLCVVSTLEGRLHYFDFTTTELLHVSTLPSGISAVELHRGSNLLVVVCDDLVLRLVDIETRKTVREFAGFRGRILDVTFSSDARWILTTSMDGVIRTFDVPSGRLVDAFKTASIATSLTMSPTGDFLATAHVDSIGVYLWANKAQFTNVSLRGLDETIDVVDDDGEGGGMVEVALPTVQGVVEDEALASLDAGEAELQRTYTSPPQLHDGEGAALVTLSTMPRSRWMTLLNLDTIKRRNKPKEAPKAPEKAPFFLPQKAGTTFEFAATPTADGNDAAAAAATAESKRLTHFGGGGLAFESDFVRRLKAVSTAQDGSTGAFFLYLSTLSVPALDVEIRSLTLPADLALFLDVLTRRLEEHLDFEAVQAMLALFLRIHSDVLIQNGVVPPSLLGGGGEGEVEVDEEASTLAKAVARCIAAHQREGRRLVDLLEHCLGTLSFLRGLPMS